MTLFKASAQCLIEVILTFSLLLSGVGAEEITGSNRPPVKDWFSAFNGTGEESHGHYIISCSDGGFLQVGETGFIPDSAKILVVKTDSNGKLLWQREFHRTTHNLGNSALELANGYLIAGAMNEDSALIKLDKVTGATIFQKIYNNGGSDAYEHLALTDDGIVAAGYIHAEDRNNTFFTEGQGYITFLDHQGNRISGLSLNKYMAHAYRMKRIDNRLIISGLTEDAQDFAVITTDLKGVIIWSKTFGGSKADHCFALDVSSDGMIFLGGHTLSGTANWDTYAMKIDSDGNQLWEQKIGNPRGFEPKYIHDEAWGIKATDDGGCIIVGGTGDEYRRYSEIRGNQSSDQWQVYLGRFNPDGDLLLQQTFGKKGTDWAGEAIDLTADGGAIIAVDNGRFGFLKIKPF